jgi:putative ABC transport system permease protein
MEALIKDLRFGFRSLWKRPGLSAIAIVTLALGIGNSTAIFSVVNAVVLRPLPYAQPERLMMLWESMPGNDHRSVAPGNLLDWRAQNRSFEELAATFYASFNLAGNDGAERIDGATVTSNLMTILGAKAQLGRTFQPEDDEHADRNLVILSDGLWKKRLGGDRNVIGRTIPIDDTPHTIVGVMAAGFEFPTHSQLWVLGRERTAVPLSLRAQFPNNDWLHERDAHFLSVIGRLKPNVTVSQAQSDIGGISRMLEHDFPQTNAGLGSNVVPLHTQIVGDVRKTLLILLGAVGFVLLICCTNVANLLLARAAQREREISIRAAVGASRLRLVRQLLTESMILGLAGGLAGLLLSIWVLKLLVQLSPGNIPRLNEASLDLRVLVFTLMVSLLTGLAFGLLPAFQSTRDNLNATLKDSGNKVTAGRQAKAARNVLVASEIALAQVLLVGACLLTLSYVRVTGIHPGFDPDRVLTAKIAPSRQKYPDPQSRIAFFKNVLSHFKNLPGVESAGLVMDLPLSGSSMNRGFRVEGRPEAKPDENVTMDYQVVSPDYFTALNIPLKQGRGLNEADSETSPRVIVVNEAMARRYWPNENPVGKRMAIGESSKETSWRTIVGVVGDVRQASISEAAVPTSFISYQQDLESWPRMGFVIKTRTNPTSLSSTIRHELALIDPGQPIYAIEPLENAVHASVAQRLFVMVMLGALAATALVLATIGMYGVISFSVSERTHEIGIRMALGAHARDVLKMVLAYGLRVTLVGIALGLCAGLALTRLLSGMLFEVNATDFRIFLSVGFLLTLVVGLACYLPARRATKVDPLIALRYE